MINFVRRYTKSALQQSSSISTEPTSSEYFKTEIVTPLTNTNTYNYDNASVYDHDGDISSTSMVVI